MESSNDLIPNSEGADEQVKVCKCCQIFLTIFFNMLPCLPSYLLTPCLSTQTFNAALKTDGRSWAWAWWLSWATLGSLRKYWFGKCTLNFLTIFITCRHSHHRLFSHLALHLELLMQRGRGEEGDGPGHACHHGQPRLALEMNVLVSTLKNFWWFFSMSSSYHPPISRMSFCLVLWTQHERGEKGDKSVCGGHVRTDRQAFESNVLVSAVQIFWHF